MGDVPSLAASTNSRMIPTGATWVLFHEYFHGDNGGWSWCEPSKPVGTGLVAKLLEQSGE